MNEIRHDASIKGILLAVLLSALIYIALIGAIGLYYGGLP